MLPVFAVALLAIRLLRVDRRAGTVSTPITVGVGTTETRGRTRQRDEHTGARPTRHDDGAATATRRDAARARPRAAARRGYPAAAKAMFTGNCGGCHTLADAGTTGTVGPNLDELKPDEATVEHQIANGGGAMPAKAC